MDERCDYDIIKGPSCDSGPGTIILDFGSCFTVN